VRDRSISPTFVDRSTNSTGDLHHSGSLTGHPAIIVVSEGRGTPQDVAIIAQLLRQHAVEIASGRAESVGGSRPTVEDGALPPTEQRASLPAGQGSSALDDLPQQPSQLEGEHTSRDGAGVQRRPYDSSLRTLDTRGSNFGLFFLSQDFVKGRLGEAVA